MPASLIGHWVSSTFRLSTVAVSMSLAGSRFSSESALKALPSWGSKTRRNNLSGGLAIGRTAGPSGHTNSPHPSSREGHHSTAWWNLNPPILFDWLWRSCHCAFPCALELGAIHPHAVHDHSQSACQRHDRLLHPALLGDLHGPGLEPRPSCRTHQHDMSRLVEHRPHHLVPALRYCAGSVDLARLIFGRRQPKCRPNRLGVFEAGRHIDTGAEGQSHHRADPRDTHQTPADLIVPHDGQPTAVQDGELIAKDPPNDKKRFGPC